MGTTRGSASLRGMAHISNFGGAWGSNIPWQSHPNMVHTELSRLSTKKNTIYQQLEWTAARYDTLVKRLEEIESREARLYDMLAGKKEVAALVHKAK